MRTFKEEQSGYAMGLALRSLWWPDQRQLDGCGQADKYYDLMAAGVLLNLCFKSIVDLVINQPDITGGIDLYAGIARQGVATVATIGTNYIAGACVWGAKLFLHSAQLSKPLAGKVGDKDIVIAVYSDAPGNTQSIAFATLLAESSDCSINALMFNQAYRSEHIVTAINRD